MSQKGAGGLGPMELKVLTLVSLGNSNGDIGRQLEIGEDTVKTYLRRIFAKLDAVDRAHAVRRAIEEGELKINNHARTSLIPATPRDPLYQDVHYATCFAAEACPCRQPGRQARLLELQTTQAAPQAASPGRKRRTKRQETRHDAD